MSAFHPQQRFRLSEWAAPAGTTGVALCRIVGYGPIADRLLAGRRSKNQTFIGSHAMSHNPPVGMERGERRPSA